MNSIGRKLITWPWPKRPKEIVGVVANSRTEALTQNAEPAVSALSQPTVSQRIQEIGIRKALGAQRSDVLRMVLRQGMVLVGVGMVTGLMGALAFGRLMRSLLFNVSPTDPATFVTIAILLCAVALLACWLPARRATRTNPMEALRYE